MPIVLLRALHMLDLFLNLRKNKQTNKPMKWGHFHFTEGETESLENNQFA